MARLLFFGKLGDLAGGRMRELKLTPAARTVAELITMMKQTDPSLGEALNDPSIRFIVNEQVTSVETAISDTDEIAFLPPVSGG